MEYVKLEEITINLDNRRKPLNDIDRNKIKKNKLYPYCGANNIMDYIDEYLFDEEILCIAEDGGNWGYNKRCCYIMNEKCWVNNHAHVIKGKDNSLNLKYLYYYINHINLNNRITGTTRGKLTKNSLNSIEVWLPIKNIQNKIVQVLDTTQSLIEKRKQQIEECDKLIKTKFIKVFGEPVKNSKNWTKMKLCEVCDVRDGTHESPQYILRGYPLVTSKNIINGKIDLNNVNYISKEDYDNINKRSKVDKGDIIMPMIGTIGNPTIVYETPEFAIKNVALIKCNQEIISNIYIQQILSSELMSYIKVQKSRGGTQKFLSLGDIRNLEIPIPSLDLQNKFADFVQTIENQKKLLEQSLTNLQATFNTLSQKAFQGELFSEK